MEEDNRGSTLGNVIRIDDERVREHLGRIVRGTVGETLNAMLEAEADRLCNAGRHERTQAWRDQRSGSYDRKLATKAGEVKAPQLRDLLRLRVAEIPPGTRLTSGSLDVRML